MKLSPTKIVRVVSPVRSGEAIGSSKAKKGGADAFKTSVDDISVLSSQLESPLFERHVSFAADVKSPKRLLPSHELRVEEDSSVSRTRSNTMNETNEIFLQELSSSFRRPRAYAFDATFDNSEVSAFLVRSPRADDSQSNQED